MSALVIHRAVGWLPDGRRVTAEDFDTAADAIEALRLAKLAWHPRFTNYAEDATLDALADQIAHSLGLDPGAPYGRTILVA